MIASAAAFLAAIVIQFGVPLCGILTEECRRDQWTWSMFSGHQVSHAYAIVVDGEPIDIDPVDVIGLEGRIPYGRDRLARLCDVRPGAQEVVRVRYYGSSSTETRVTCD